MDSCYCGRSAAYTHCCEPLHLGKAKAATAEQLMRSRYAAFCTHNIDYLLNTLHPSQHSNNERAALQGAIKQTQWLSLRIISSHKHTVEFIAFYQADPVGQLHERSNFVCENGQWFYTNGEQLPAIKIGRNDSCYCGSGKKFKKCCSL